MKILNKRMDEIGTMQKDSRKIYNQIDQLEESGQAYTPSANQIIKQLNEFKINVKNEMYDYIKQQPDIVSFYMLIDEMKHYKSNKMYQNINTLNELQEMFAMKFKYHPYTKLSQELIWSIKNIKVGGKYFDFTLSDINGKSFTFSKEIEGKYAMVIFWAPWCSPCIASSRYMIPVFEEFKDKGFTIVGVAGKYKNINEVKDRLQKDKYPWITLIDPDWESSVWTRYGLKGSGGESFLIDDKGKIIAIYPSSDEVRSILMEKLN
jgi:thiol-disulfide isomerase/thioredoxin